MADIKKDLERLIAEYGVDALQEAAAGLDNSLSLQIPADHLGVLNPKALQYSVNQLNASFNEILKAGEEREACYQEIGDLRKRSRELDTDIELSESMALMSITYDGKNAYGKIVIDGRETEVQLSNDKARKAYMSASSKEQRKEKAKVDGEILKIEARIKKCTAKWESYNNAAQNASVKATLQANLIKYIARD